MALEDRIRLPVLNLIHRRRRLLNLLDGFIEANHRLITIYAPGGYGKTIFLADFAQTTDLPVCWCSLEIEDRDPTHFLTLLTYSITDRFREINPAPLLNVVSQGETQASINRISRALEPVGSHIIIFDDYHKAISGGMTLTLNSLLERLPDNSTIILAARGDIELETGQVIDLLMTNRASGLSEVELAFTGPEIQRVMRKRFGRRIDLADAEAIASVTEGNIAQILLTGHMQSQHTGELVSRLSQRLGEDREIIYDYMAAKVFGKQPPDLQQFMRYTAVLPDMTVDLCNKLMDFGSGQHYLDTLVREDLFVMQKGAGFQYHDLFREFLLAKLAEDKQTYRQITIKGASLLAQTARYEEAINLYLSVQAWDEAAELIRKQGKILYDYGRAFTLYDWLAEIPEPDLYQRPWLMLLRGQIANDDLGNTKQAMASYEQAEQVFLEQGDLIGVVEAEISQSVALRMMGRPKEALSLAFTAYERLEGLNAEKALIAQVIRNRGLAYAVAGDIVIALSDLRQALKLYDQTKDFSRVAICHHDLGVCLRKQGNITAANHHYKEAIRLWEKLGNSNNLANSLNSLGVSLYLTGNYDEALKQFKYSLDIGTQITSPRRIAFAWAGIGDTYVAQKRYNEALEAYTISTNTAIPAGILFLRVYNMVKQGHCFYYQDNLEQALNLANSAQELAQETNLTFELGLASFLLAKIHCRQGEYSTGYKLFSQAAGCFKQNDLLEEVIAQLWAAYSLFLDSRTSAALVQLQAALKLILSMGELIAGLKRTVTEIKEMLYHFLYRPDVAQTVRDEIKMLLDQINEAVITSEPHLQISALGWPMLLLNGQQKRFTQRGGASNLPEFLLFLVLEGRQYGCRWHELSAKLWPDVEADKASTLFHQNLRRLRKSLFDSPDYITLQDDYYQINPHYLKWCDALVFEALQARIIKNSLANEVLSLQLEMVNLYQGEFLTGFELNDWGLRKRTSYELWFLQALTLAAEQLLNEDKPAEALEIIDKGLRQDYYRETLHLLALRAYARLGLLDNLHSHYATIVERFNDELNLPPDKAIRVLYRQLLQDWQT